MDGFPWIWFVLLLVSAVGLVGLMGFSWVHGGGPMRDRRAPPPWWLYRLGFRLAVFTDQRLMNLLVPAHLRLGLLCQPMMKAQVVYVVARLRVADALGDGERKIDDLAADLAVDPDGLRRVMRAACTFGIFKQVRGRPDTYGNTGLSAGLRSDHPNDMTDLICAVVEPSWGAWGGLLHATRTGENAFEHHSDGIPFWDKLHQSDRRTRTFAGAMAAGDHLNLPSVMADYTWSGYQRIVDLGGSLGTVLSALLTRHPHMRGVLFDLPNVVEAARQHWEAEHPGLLDRATLVGGSFFEEVPEAQDGDAYVMRVVLHDWKDEDAIAILRRIREAMGGREARLILLELVIDEPEPVASKLLLDLHMMVNFSSGERTRQQWDRVLEPAGFRIAAVHPTRSLHSVIECVPIPNAP